MAKSSLSAPGLGPSIWVIGTRLQHNQQTLRLHVHVWIHRITSDRSMSAADALNRHNVSLEAPDGRDTAKKAPAEAVRLLHRVWSSSFRKTDAATETAYCTAVGLRADRIVTRSVSHHLVYGRHARRGCTQKPLARLSTSTDAGIATSRLRIAR